MSGLREIGAALAVLGALAARPAPAVAQTLRLGAAVPAGGTVTGRACLDLGGDGRCDAGDPGIAGARLLLDGGEVAIADGAGRFHFLSVAGRRVGGDRTAYGGHVLASEGLGARRGFELAPGGAARVDLAIRAPGLPALALGAAEVEGAPPPRRTAGGLRWPLQGRAEGASAVTVNGVPAALDAGGRFWAEVDLAPGENAFVVVARGPSGAAVSRAHVALVPRTEGGDLVVPSAPEPLARLAIAAATGGGVLLRAALAPGLRARVGGVRCAAAEEVAAYAPAPRAGEAVQVELESPGGAVASVALPAGPEAGLAAAAALADLQLSFGGGPGTLLAARGAANVRGGWAGLSLQAGFDLDDRDRDAADLLRPRDGLALGHVTDPVRLFATAGDDGASDDRNAGRGRLWARADGEGLALRLGDARGAVAAGELGRYDRALFGASAAVEREVGPARLSARAFGASTATDANGAAPPRAAHDELAATGGAILWLSGREVVAGSEAVRIAWRDPFTGRLAEERVLARGVDYAIDYPTGRLELARPLATVAPPAALSSGDPFAAAEAVVRVDYLRADVAGRGEDLGGGSLEAALGPVTLGALGAAEGGAGGDYALAAAHAALDLGPVLALRGELARSDGAPGADEAPAFARSTDGGLGFGAPAAPDGGATAVHLEARGAAGPGRWEAWWRDRPRGFADLDHLEAVGARERGAEASADLGPVEGALLWAERRGADPRDPTGLTLLDAERTRARATLRGEQVDLTGEVLHERLTAPAAGEQAGAGVRADWRGAPGVVLDASHFQGFAASGAATDQTFTAAGATFTEGAARMGVRAGWGPALGPRVQVSGGREMAGEAVYGTFSADPDAPSLVTGSGAALGTRSRAGGTEVWTEEQVAEDALGTRVARAFGGAVEPVRGLRVSVNGERGSRLRLDGREVARAVVGGAVSWVRGPVRLSARAEGRDEEDDAQAGAGGAAEWRASPRLTLTGRTDWTHGTSAGDEALLFQAAAGAAFRGEHADALAQVARVAERRGGDPRRDAMLANLAAAAFVSPRVELGAGAHLGLNEVAGVDDDRVAGSVRARVRVRGPFDAAVEYSRRAALGRRTLGDLDAVRVEAGAALGAGRLAAGWDVLGFRGSGVDATEVRGRFYLRAQLVY